MMKKHETQFFTRDTRVELTAGNTVMVLTHQLEEARAQVRFWERLLPVQAEFEDYDDWDVSIDDWGSDDENPRR